eukprot:Blabericola_migrator_1__4142@NODE_2265_length_3036_cov_18_970024_g515_i1_p1_GENE_NODE_2265_length_3036_cov_18_970024_g515_i1NODE_2265_length_3036_cov_18_970024_g515_i1_p1_ORF_typecomplete_len250_score13_69_NODE_2265_length_3036_cov_18_970024_g515_i115112260
MNARAANVFVQQAQQSQRVGGTKHDASLLFTGVVMAMTSDYTDAIRPAEECFRAPFWQEVYACTDYITCEEECCGFYLFTKNIMKRDADTGELTLVLTESSVREIRDLRDLVVICQFLNFVIARDTKRTDADPANELWYEWALAEYSALSEEHVWRSPDELTAGKLQLWHATQSLSSHAFYAVERFQELIAVKLYHAALLQDPHCTRPAATKVWARYLRLSPTDLVTQHSEVRNRFRRLRTNSATDRVS